MQLDYLASIIRMQARYLPLNGPRPTIPGRNPAIEISLTGLMAANRRMVGN